MKRSNAMTQHPLPELVFSVSLLLGGTAAAEVAILVNQADFASVEKAAQGEEDVDWWDADLSDDRACTECFAAVELSRFLPLCASVSRDAIRFQAPDRLPPAGDVFLLGSRRSNPLIASRNPADDAELQHDQSFRIRARYENQRTITTIEGKDRVGALYGAYGYLEQLGVRFYGLGEKGTVYPSKAGPLPRNLNIVRHPSFLSRGFIGLGDRGDKDIFFWMARNRMNYCDETGKDAHFRKKLGMILVDGGHNVQATFLGGDAEYPYDHPRFRGEENKPKDPYPAGGEYAGDSNGDGKLTYFEARPEWYGLRNGKRSSRLTGAGDNFCTSNKDARKELAKNMVQSLADGPWRHVDVVNLWMLDNGKWCECDNCRRQGALTDRLFEVAYSIQKEIQHSQRAGRLPRNVQLATLAYHETLAPPQRPLPSDFDYDNFSVTFFPIERCYVHSLADPACAEINRFLLEHYQGWTMGAGRQYKGSILIGEYYNVSSFKTLPAVFPSIMAADIPWYCRTGARHFHYMHTPTHLWGVWTLNQYLLARLLWNAESDADAVLEEYFRRYYPTTFEHARRFYRYLEQATANLKTFKHYAGPDRYSLRRRLTDDSAEMFPLKHLHYEAFHPETDDGQDIVEMVDAMRLARREMDAALMECGDETEQARLREDDLRLEYGEAMTQFNYHLVRTAVFHRRHHSAMASHEFRRVEKYAEQLRRITDLVAPLDGRPAGDANAADGFEATQAVNVYEFFRERYGAKSRSN
jgi:hypothetical protein